ncbi:MAG: endonuclease/exonuclease/phosphatase family protein [Lewinellaceae bacterium]|nr:endonuclease/exonuclease/phosphatase family protein [Lewinellaceae bacterium]
MKWLLMMVFIFCLQNDILTNANLSPIPKFYKNYQDPNSTITLLSLNTWGLPIPHNDDDERFENIRNIIKDSLYSIVCLQETFNSKLRHILLESSFDFYNIYSDHTKNRSCFMGLIKMDEYGGLFTLSKFPILDEQFFQFPIAKNSSLVEKVAHKGLLISTLIIGEIVINVVNTHLYAEENQTAGEIRNSQLNYLIDRVALYQSTHPYPTLLIGDLNINGIRTPDDTDNSYKEINLNILSGCTNLEISEPMKTSHNHPSNSYYNKHEPQQRLDYTLMFNYNTSDIKTNILMDQQIITFDGSKVSDHSGLLTQLTFNKPNTTTEHVSISENDALVFPNIQKSIFH